MENATLKKEIKTLLLDCKVYKDKRFCDLFNSDINNCKTCSFTVPKSKPISIKQVIKKVIDKKYREEAFEIVDKASKFRQNELINYYNQNKYNIVCMHLDLIKQELVEYGVMVQKESDVFGSSLFG